MRTAIKSTWILGLLPWAGSAQADGSVSFSVELNPFGDFIAKTKAVRGSAHKQGAAYVSEKLLLDLDTLDSGKELRDDHMKNKYFETNKSKKNKFALLTDARGEGGKFSATLMIRGHKAPISGTYEISDGKVVAKFKAKMSDYKISKAEYMGVGAMDEVAVTAEIPIKAK